MKNIHMHIPFDLMFKGATLCLLFLLIQTVCYAQQSPPYCPNKPDNVYKMMESLKIWRITEELNVDETLASKLFPRIHELENERRSFRKNIQKQVKKLSACLDAKPMSNDLLKQEINAYMSMLKRHNKEEERLLKRVLELLTPEQQARYLKLEFEFPKRIRDFLHKRRHRGNKLTRGKRERTNNYDYY